jgi:hypothetical protein
VLIVNKPNIFFNRLFSSALQKKDENILSGGAGERVVVFYGDNCI